MKIGIVLSNTPGYSETFFNSNIKGLQHHGMEVFLYCQNKSKDFDLCPVVLAPKVSANRVLQFWYILKEFFFLIPHFQAVLGYIKLERREHAGVALIFKKIYLNAHILKAKLDWLHFGFATQALGSETVAKAIGSKMAVSFRGFDINVYPLKFPDCYKKLWKHVDKVHSISHYLLNNAITLGLSAKTPSTIITPAVQLDTLPISNKLASSSAVTIKLVTVARLTWIKGLDVAIAAMGKLKEKKINFTYHIIGDGIKNYVERYKFMVYELGLTEQVIFCGKLSHRETLENVATADIYIQPSLNEGFCNAVLEAQALGKLTIATNVGGLRENIVDGKTGWLFEMNSPESLVQKIEIILNLSEGDKKTISNHAQKRVRQEFNIENQQHKFVEFYSNNSSE